MRRIKWLPVTHYQYGFLIELKEIQMKFKLNIQYLQVLRFLALLHAEILVEVKMENLVE